MRLSSQTLACLPAFYTATRRVSRLIGYMLKSVWPKYHEDYEKAFAAGRFIDEDSGPYIGRAIVYKLQVNLHVDKHDAGPTACFPMGTWTKNSGGGELLVPQLGAKFKYVLVAPAVRSFCSPVLHFRYDVGHVAIFFASRLLHKVATWKPAVGNPSDAVTPGRIGNVFFFPTASLNVLKDKDPGWGKKTAFGAWSFMVDQGKQLPKSLFYLPD